MAASCGIAWLVLVAVTPVVRAAPPGERLFQSDCAGCHGPRGEGAIGPPLAVPRLARARDQAGLTKIIKQGIEGTEMPGARRTQAEVAQLATWVLRLGARPMEKVPGDPVRGEALYTGKGACATCHTIRGQGGALGTDLTDIGLRRGASHLRQSIVDPEAAVPRAPSIYREDVSLSQNFLQVRVVTADGAELTGVRLNEDTFSIQLRDVTNRVHSFWKSELRALHKDWGRSPMPSYREAFTAAELDDLVAYLVGLRGDPS